MQVHEFRLKPPPHCISQVDAFIPSHWILVEYALGHGEVRVMYSILDRSSGVEKALTDLFL